MEGRHEACRGCAINCYFEPSFATDPTLPYFWQSLPSKARYAWTKFVMQRLRAKLGPRAVILPDFDEQASSQADVRGDDAMIDLLVL